MGLLDLCDGFDIDYVKICLIVELVCMFGEVFIVLCFIEDGEVCSGLCSFKYKSLCVIVIVLVVMLFNEFVVEV